MESLSVIRAVAAVLAGSVVRTAGWIIFFIVIFIFSLIIWLGINVSGWWYVFLLPVTLVSVILLAVFLILRLVLRRTYPKKLSREQRTQLIAFGEKVRFFAKSHGSSLPLLGAQIVKDLTVNHNAQTLQALVQDSSSLRDDFTALEKSLRNT